MLSNDIHDYYYVSQGKTTIPNMDDGEEFTLTDVRTHVLFLYALIVDAPPNTPVPLSVHSLRSRVPSGVWCYTTDVRPSPPFVTATVDHVELDAFLVFFNFFFCYYLEHLRT